MNWGTLSPIIISTTVCAAAVSAIANFVVALMSNHLLKTIEKNKHLNELTHYRYSKLHSLLEDLEKEHGFVNYPDDISRTFQESLEKRVRFVAIYKLSRPLLKDKFRKQLDEYANDEEYNYKIIVSSVIGHDIDNIKEHIPNWNKSVNCFLEALGEIIHNQIAELTESY